MSELGPTSTELEPTLTSSNPTATEVLRALLDERGVEYVANDGEHVKETCWSYMGELTAAFAEYDNGTTRFACDTWCFTPEQAIAATLGTVTCYDEGDPSDFCCSECGVRMFTNTSDTYTMVASDGRTIIKHPNFCPNCGARVVEPTTNDVDAEVGA